MRKCRAARHFKGIKVFQHHRKGEKGWKEFDAIEEEGLLDEEGGYKGIPRRCYLLAFIVGFFVLFTFFALILWGAIRNQKPIVTVKSWLLYASRPINLSYDVSTITSSVFSGIIRITVLPEPKFEAVLDRFSSCYPISGDAVFTKPFCLEYKWDKRGWGDLLMLAHPLHLHLLWSTDCSVTILGDFKYNSIDGEVKEESYSVIIEALVKDVDALNSSTISTTSSYFYGKLIARAARFALIAEEVCYPEVIPAIRQFLKDMIEPWMDGTFGANGFLYDPKWGGIVTKQGSLDPGADFGFGIYNDHHYHLGYFIYGIAVLAKIDAAWGRKYRPQAYVAMNFAIPVVPSGKTRQQVAPVHFGMRIIL
ncbi:glycosyl hydrolase family 81 protein [Abeliophyllum distichum]|uniref:glucan endo-1,3-beta-D-glucosidase n=1 Tax=Abeliophyllum distichum TaxID=126358 RepID=A0ABD1QY75_9LAMI